MKKEKYIEDLEEIKKFMNQSSRFVSLSGMAGISVGIIGLAATWITFRMEVAKSLLAHYHHVEIGSDSSENLLLTGIITLLAAIISGIFFTYRKTRRTGEKIWTPQTKRLISDFSIPAFTGGLIVLILFTRGLIGLVLPLTLVFYGLGLVNASKHTLKAIKNLGILEVILGILALNFISFSLILWAIGFGLLHIIYGIIIPMKTKS